MDRSRELHAPSTRGWMALDERWMRSERLGPLSLQLQEPELARDTPHVLAGGAVLGDHAVAGDDDRQRIGEQDGHHLGAAVRPPHGLGEAAAGAGAAVGDLGRLLEHAPRERIGPRGAEIELEIQTAAGPREVLGEPPEDLVQEVRAVDLVERREGGQLRLGRLEADARQRRAEDLDAERPEGRRHQDPERLGSALRRGAETGLSFHLEPRVARENSLGAPLRGLPAAAGTGTARRFLSRAHSTPKGGGNGHSRETTEKFSPSTATEG